MQLDIEPRDLLQGVVGAVDGIGDPSLGIGAQRLDPLRRRVELLRHRLRGIDDADARRLRIRAGRQALQRGQELVVGVLDRAGGVGIAVDPLQIGQEARAHVGVAGTRRLGAKLGLQEFVELAVDAVDQDARAVLAGGTGGLVQRLLDVARRLRVGDVRRHERQRGLRGAQARHRGGKGLAQTHVVYSPLLLHTCIVDAISAPRSEDPAPSNWSS